MSFVSTRPVDAAMAFGGVADGSTDATDVGRYRDGQCNSDLSLLIGVGQRCEDRGEECKEHRGRCRVAHEH